jgi:hypothetical protein
VGTDWRFAGSGVASEDFGTTVKPPRNGNPSLMMVFKLDLSSIVPGQWRNKKQQKEAAFNNAVCCACQWHPSGSVTFL